MKTSRSMRRQRRTTNLIALIVLMLLLGLANYATYIIGGLVLPLFLAIISLLVLINFPWYKFK